MQADIVYFLQHFGTGSPVKGAGNGLADYLPVSDHHLFIMLGVSSASVCVGKVY